MAQSDPVRGKTTTVPQLWPPARATVVERLFRANAPNHPLGADLTYVATWSSFVYAAVVIDMISRRSAGWTCSHRVRTGFAPDALEQGLRQRARDCPRVRSPPLTGQKRDDRLASSLLHH